MAAIKVYVSDDVEKRFREMAMRIYGYGKGSLSIASEKAFSQWISSMADVVEILETMDNPVDAVSGLLSGINADGVGLQHAAREVRAQGRGEANDGH